MKNIFRYLTENSSQPIEVDRLIVSAFIEFNGIKLKNNQFLLKYRIQKKQKKEYQKLVTFIEIIKLDIKLFNIEKLIELFEFVVSPSDRIVNGAIYTPAYIREYIIKQAFSKFNNLQTIKIADISCGCSGFLYTAAKELKKITNQKYQQIFENQIFGLDIQEYSVTRSKILLSLLALSEKEDFDLNIWNIYKGDALVFNWGDHYENFEGFQAIVGNPPYVCARNLLDDVKSNLKNWEVCTSGNPDLYIPFFQIGYENLAEDGILGYITMNTFFKSLNGRALRKYFNENQIPIQIIDFGTLQIFKSKSTYTCICFLKKNRQNYIEYYKSKDKELPFGKKDYQKIRYSNLDTIKGWNLNNNKLISQIEAIGTPFGKKFNTRHGIATLKNDIYIFTPIKEDDDFFYLQNGSIYPIEKGICKDILNSNKLSRSVELKNVKEKLIFPYNDENRPKLFNENYFKNTYPNAFKYLKSKKNILAKRDKGNGKYEKWFAFGRTQSLERINNKLFFPKFSDKIPNYIISDDDNLLFYNGQAVIGHTEEEMLLIKKIMESRLFWYYIKTTSKPYSSNYYSLNGTYIKNFGIPNFTDEDIHFLINETDKNKTDDFIESFYGIKLNEEL